MSANSFLLTKSLQKFLQYHEKTRRQQVTELNIFPFIYLSVQFNTK